MFRIVLLLLFVALITPYGSALAQQFNAPENAVVDEENSNPYIENRYFSIFTGSLSGIYYPIGGAICRVFNRDHAKEKQFCTHESTTGSIYNLRALKDIEANIAIVQSDWQENAVNGTSIFSNEGPLDNLRHVMSLYTEAINVVVRKNSDIYAIDDIKGKIINLGLKGSGTRASVLELIKVKGWTANNFNGTTELPNSEQARALCNNEIDVMIVAAGTPNNLVADAASSCEIRMIELIGEDIDDFVNNNPKYTRTVIPGGVYAGVQKDARTYGFKATLVTTNYMSDELIYNLTKSLFENLEQFKGLHPVLLQLNKNNMINEGRTAELHAGAKKYYLEAGLLKQ